ncbi:hypothetical protein KSF_108040 [Reticulibacter mediterranei]|uniref:Uncharacterized protein n=2 Tax=Reticulibacter mediterranei TaxID=2778369 RepID=A0A8J3J397_9CHLR|nr:hypothetical protein KSF_108040 [Reticulibacter mediterranei]
MANPFLIADVDSACRQARVYYVDTLVQMQRNGGRSESFFNAELERRLNNLDQAREAAHEAAYWADLSTAIAQLVSIVLEWGIYKAIQDLLQARGVYIDPHDPALSLAFDRTIQGKLISWATELQNTWSEGERQRNADQMSVYMQRNGRLYTQIIQEQGKALHNVQQCNQQLADSTIRAIDQAQQSVQWMMGESKQILQNAGQNVNWLGERIVAMQAEVQKSMQEGLKAQKEVTKSIEQNLPREKEKSQFWGQVKGCGVGCLSRGCLGLLILLFGGGVFYGVYLLMQHVVLH